MKGDAVKVPIAKMTFVDINGSTNDLDNVLMRCMISGLFQPENAAKLSEYSVGAPALLANPYGGLLVKMIEIASALDFQLDSIDKNLDSGAFLQDNSAAFVEETHAYLNNLRREYPLYFEKQARYQSEISAYTSGMEILKHIDLPGIDFDALWENAFLKLRFGRLPTYNLSKLAMKDAKPYQLYQLDSNASYTWVLYITASEYHDEIDEMFANVAFERLRVPDFVHGSVTDGMQFIAHGLEEEKEKLTQAGEEIKQFVIREKSEFFSRYCKVKFLHDTYELRKFAVSIRDNFHLIGFVLTSEQDSFKQLFSDLPNVNITLTKAGADARIPPPIFLKNNWFVRPFEMFVGMYGSPCYNDIDPTPFVAYTYSIFFGMMFGDVGQGFIIFLAGLFLGNIKKLPLGRIMQRIGVMSMLFGGLYGSVFGYEHMLDPFYIGVLGLSGKPIDVMHPATTNRILIAAIGIGVLIIFMVICFNMIIGIKHRDIDRVFFSHNGLAGLVFYGAVVYAGVGTITGTASITPVYIIFLILLPLTLIFFREPIAHYMAANSASTIIKQDENLSENTTFHHGSLNISELFKSQYMTARFGRIPTDSYRKLSFYEGEPFLVYPVKTDREYIWCIYTCAIVSKQEIDAIFHDLYFERIFIPDDMMGSNELAESYITKCLVAGGSPTDYDDQHQLGIVKTAMPKTVMQTIFPEGIGNFITQTIFEMFEILLSFTTNTISFLRVGGFILVHAGMMSVVFTLSAMAGAGASPFVIIIGNIFVLCLEGLIVGIQALRLEFYEIFSRFYSADGVAFSPVSISYSPNAN